MSHAWLTNLRVNKKEIKHIVLQTQFPELEVSKEVYSLLAFLEYKFLIINVSKCSKPKRGGI